MPSTRTRAALGALTATTLALGGVLSGCSLRRDEEPAASSSTQAPEPVESTDPEPSPTPSASPTPTEQATTTPAPSRAASPATPEGALLSAAELPQLNDTAAWTVRRTRPVGTEPFGRCHKFDLLSIGAMNAVERTYAHETDSAAQVVAEFPDAQTAVRADKVLESWHRDCASRVRERNLEVGTLTPVQVADGTGWWYLLSWATPRGGHFHSLGVVRSGSRMTLLRMDHDGQDHNYEPGADPMELAVEAAAAKLG